MARGNKTNIVSLSSQKEKNEKNEGEQYNVVFPKRKRRTMNMKTKKKKKIKYEDARPMTVSGCWSDLQQPLLELILKRLPIRDYLRCGAVCRSWQAIEQQRTPQHHHHHHPQLPWLMLDNQKFYSIMDEETYKLKLHKLQGRPCIFSNQGWLVMGAHHYISKRVLVNPITKERYHLPPQTDYSHSDYCVLSSSLTDEECVVIRIKSWCRIIDFLRPRKEPSWARLECDYKISSNFIFHQGVLYALHSDKIWLVTIDCRSSDPVVMLLELDYNIVEPKRRFVGEFYLVESCGEILLVSARSKLNSLPQPFKVYKADFSKKVWVEADNLSGRILFLSRKCSMSVSASETGGRGNCIYYISTESAEEGYWVQYYLGSKFSKRSRAVGHSGKIECWFMPTLA